MPNSNRNFLRNAAGFLIICYFLSHTPTSGQELSLNVGERESLERHRELTFALDDENPPLNFRSEAGGYIGMSIDYVDLRTKKLGIDITYERSSWNEELRKASETIPDENRAEYRQKWIHIDYRHGFDYSLFWKAGLPLLAVLLLTVYWNRRMSREIKNRKKAEEMLSRYHDRLEQTIATRTKELHRLATAINQSAEAVVIVSSRGIIRFVNPGFERISSIPFDTAVGSRIGILGSPLNTESFRTEILNELKTHGNWKGTINGRNRNGEEYLVEGTISAVFDESGKIANIVAILRDVTNERRMESWLALALDSVNAGIWEYDIAREVFHFDPRTADILGYSGELMPIERWENNVVHPEEAEEAKQIFSRLTSGKSQSDTLRFRARNQSSGNWLHVMATVGIAERSDEGYPRRLIGTIVDITERQLLEERLLRSQKMEAIGTLAGGIAHDFNNILTAILGYAELAFAEAENEPGIRESLSAIMTSSERARELVQQILTFAREKKRTNQPLRVAPLIKEALKLIRSSLPSTIRVESQLDEDIIVAADQTQIHQVLMNLCTNAAASMPDGGVLEVEMTQVALGSDQGADNDKIEPGSYMRLTVRDTGTGMSTDTRRRIFEPFFTTKSESGGTGLGLSVTHGIVEGLGGTIDVESAPGIGSVFTILIPSIQSQEPVAERSESPIPLGNETILIVDDEKAILDLFSSMLRKLGYTVLNAGTGNEAMELFRNNEESIDLILSDITMPGITGDDVAKRVRNHRPRIPIILCSGFGDRIADDLTEEIGEYIFLSKPISLSELATSVREALDGSI